MVFEPVGIWNKLVRWRIGGSVLMVFARLTHRLLFGVRIWRISVLDFDVKWKKNSLDDCAKKWNSLDCHWELSYHSSPVFACSAAQDRILLNLHLLHLRHLLQWMLLLLMLKLILPRTLTIPSFTWPPAVYVPAAGGTNSFDSQAEQAGETKTNHHTSSKRYHCHGCYLHGIGFNLWRHLPQLLSRL